MIIGTGISQSQCKNWRNGFSSYISPRRLYVIIAHGYIVPALSRFISYIRTLYILRAEGKLCFRIIISRRNCLYTVINVRVWIYYNRKYRLWHASVLWAYFFNTPGTKFEFDPTLVTLTKSILSPSVPSCKKSLTSPPIHYSRISRIPFTFTASCISLRKQISKSCTSSFSCKDKFKTSSVPSIHCTSWPHPPR